MRNVSNLEFFEDIDLETLRTMWLQHGGAPAYYVFIHYKVHEYLNTIFPGRSIGRGSTIIGMASEISRLNSSNFLYQMLIILIIKLI